MKVEYDMEKEMKNLQKKSDKIFNKYSEVDGLKDTLNKTLSQFDSEPFNILTKNLVKYVGKFDKNDIWDEMDTKSILQGNIESIAEEFHILKYSTILKDTKFIFYLPNLWDDTITFNHFLNLVSFNSGILIMKERSKISYSEVVGLTNKIMLYLNNFDQDILINSVDEEFFKNLRDIKWNKKANKLFEKLLSILLDVVVLVIATLFSDIQGKIFAAYRSTLTILIACSAVNDGRDKMEYEDVIRAFKTFYKLIDADINDLI